MIIMIYLLFGTCTSRKHFYHDYIHYSPFWGHFQWQTNPKQKIHSISSQPIRRRSWAYSFHELTLADLHSKILDARPPPPPRRPNSFNFMQFLGEFGKIVCSCPHLGKILDLPLTQYEFCISSSWDPRFCQGGGQLPRLTVADIAKWSPASGASP